MPSGRPGHLEVHVAVVIFCPCDVGKDSAYRLVCSARINPMATPATGAFNGTPAVHQGERAPTHRGHRGRSVRFEDVRHDSHGVGPAVFVWDHRQQGSFSQVAVSDLAPPRPPKELHFPDRKGWKVVVQHEAFVDLATHHLDLLLVISGPERGAHQCLGFPTCEDGGAVHARQETDLGPDRPDVAELRPSRRFLARGSRRARPVP